jgi:hypothetical protein
MGRTIFLHRCISTAVCPICGDTVSTCSILNATSYQNMKDTEPIYFGCMNKESPSVGAQFGKTNMFSMAKQAARSSNFSGFLNAI